MTRPMREALTVLVDHCYSECEDCRENDRVEAAEAFLTLMREFEERLKEGTP